MPAVITNKIVRDAVENLALHLETMQATWDVRNVYRYQSAEVGRKGNSIAIQVVGWNRVNTGFGGLTLVCSHKIQMRVWYVHGKGARADVAFNDIYDRISDIGTFLIENPRPNGYGELLEDSEGQDLQPSFETIETDAGNLPAAYVTVVHTLEGKTHNLTLTP